MLRTLPLLAAGLLTFSGAGAFAQTSDQTSTAPQQSAVAANSDAAAAIDARDAGRAGADADAQAQYAVDLAAYDTALARHDARADRQAEHYHHQQRAYADAMAAWRAQDYACRHGSHRACTAPAPDPASYW